jgi:hypothetical protein
LERLVGQSFMVVLLVTGIYIVDRLLLKATTAALPISKRAS